MGSSVSAPQLTSIAVPSHLSPCATLSIQVIASLGKNTFQAGTVCQFLRGRWDPWVVLGQVLCVSCFCHGVGVQEGGDGSEDREAGTSVPATEETAQKAFIMLFQSDGQILRNLHVFMDILQTGEHSSTLLINYSSESFAWLLCLCVQELVLGTVMKVFFGDISGCIVKL